MPVRARRQGHADTGANRIGRSGSHGVNAITKAIGDARARGTPAIVAYLTAGYPAKAGFIDSLRAVAHAADVVEIGVPFSDPMADGATIQRSNREALAQGVSLRWLLGEIEATGRVAGAPAHHNR